MTELPAPTDHRWLSVHVFYASNANPMLVECVQPLIGRLRADGLIDGWFFIKYWMEGPHVRLRLRPAADADPEAVRAAAATALEEFLRRRPALYEADSAGMGDLYKRMFLAEYGQQRWDETYGEHGAMPFRDNNSFAFIDYEREYGRYGGPAGIELAEWHFEQSSDIVTHLLGTTNVHVRPVLLGLSTQLAVMMCAVFLDDEARVASFLDDYRTFWETSYQERSDEYHESFEAGYRKIGASLRERTAELFRVARAGEGAAASEIERRWLAHCRQLRARIEALVASGALRFRRRDDAADGGPADLDAALAILLSSYVHMTNNRLGVSILDEIYLSYMTRNALRDQPVRSGAA